jgi:hypothetical protein
MMTVFSTFTLHNFDGKKDLMIIRSGFHFHHETWFQKKNQDCD